MIYVRRDSGLIPEKLLQVAERAQKKLEALPSDQRPEFIRKKSHVWRAFTRYLSKMSYGKCWYSESIDPQSFFDVDHYRPKLEAKRSDELTDPGYGWLAFSWENFRLSAQRSNRASRNEETDENEGKGNWFPLLEDSPKASWENRCEDAEQPALLDPVKKEDVRLIDVLDDGRMGPSLLCIGSARLRVERSIKIYGLDLPQLKAARLKVMREVIELHSVLCEMLEAASPATNVADKMPIQKQVDLIQSKTLPSSAYSKAARAQLMRLPGGTALYVHPEEVTA